MAGMPTPLLPLAIAVLLLPGCAGTRDTSEAQWQRGQCAQIVDREAREKCLKRVEEVYGKR
jgi:hypothetical protein